MTRREIIAVAIGNVIWSRGGGAPMAPEKMLERLQQNARGLLSEVMEEAACVERALDAWNLDPFNDAVNGLRDADAHLREANARPKQTSEQMKAALDRWSGKPGL